ncbi:RraA family protein [Rossellomorea marisflavi]|uniref:RraA family protein n=1 Tax=Rossellomorea marisflavi TaxID=189381 RepID=UPI003459C669
MTHSQKTLVARMKKLGSSVFADVMETNNVMDYHIKPVNFRESLVGRARTVALPKGDNLFLHYAIYQANPGDILIVDGQDYKEAAYLGELMAGAAEAIGVEGIIIDGLVRDRTDLRHLDIQIYAKGYLSTGPTKEGPGAFDTAITCAGAMVCPGDYVIADEDGVVVIPQGEVADILEKAEKKSAYEYNRLKQIEAFKQLENKEDTSNLEPGWLQEKLKAYHL